MYSYDDILLFIIILGVILIFANVYYKYNCTKENKVKETEEEKLTRILKGIIKQYF
jgi:hypothetical protein